MIIFDKKESKGLLKIFYAVAAFFALTAMFSLFSSVVELNQFPLDNTNKTELAEFQNPVRWILMMFSIFVAIPTFALFIIPFFYKKHDKLFLLLKILGIFLLVLGLIILRIKLHSYDVMNGEKYIVAGNKKYLMVASNDALATYLGLKSIFLQLIMCFVVMWLIEYLPYIIAKIQSKRKNTTNTDTVEE